jgi:hypothetical protein
MTHPFSHKNVSGSPPRVAPSWGGSLTEGDYSSLEASWITRDIADAAKLRRVNADEGRQITGQKGKRDCAGLLIPYYWPGEPAALNYRVRRDHPDFSVDKNGKPKPKRKYLGAPGSGNRLYFPPDVTPEQLEDVTVPAVLVEGEKKALALSRLAGYSTQKIRFIAVALPGVWNWRGVVGKTTGPEGERVDIKGPIPDLDRILWMKMPEHRTIFILFDRNVASNPSVKAARRGLAHELAKRGGSVFFINLPDDCGVNGVDDLLAKPEGPDTVLRLFEKPASNLRTEVVVPPQFESNPKGMFRVVTEGDMMRRSQLSNYEASIRRSVILDDGVESRREFEIESQLMGREHGFTIPATSFPRMDWPIEQMGPAAITFPNQKEYARTAIQSFSLTAEERRVYAHTGWRQVGGHWVYLHAGGAIGSAGPVDGVNVRLAGSLANYELSLPSGPEAVISAVRASLRLLELGPPLVSFPLRAASCRAVFGDVDFSVHLTGATGKFKSERAALEQQHFGPGMDSRHCPGSWASTANANETLAFLAKDAILLIDDFNPRGSAAEVDRYHAAADRVFRAVGNHAGRGRLDSTAKLRDVKPPRGLILSTGEDVPRGQSLRARLLILEVQKGDIERHVLGSCQADARTGLYAGAMGAFIQWVAGRYEKLRADLNRHIAELRSTAIEAISGQHARTPAIIADLQAAFEIFLRFAEECGAISSVDREKLGEECWEALVNAATDQVKHQVASEPAAQFLSLLRDCLSSGRAHLAGTTGGVPVDAPDACGWREKRVVTGKNEPDRFEWYPLGDRIGWTVDDNVYLLPEAAYHALQVMARNMGEPFPITPHTLRKRLAEKGLLASRDLKRETFTIRVTIGGSRPEVLHVLRSSIFPSTDDV